MVKRLINFLHALLLPPHYDDAEKNRIAKFLHVITITIIAIAILIGTIDAVAGILATGEAIIIGIMPLLLSFWLTRRDHLKAASYITLTSLIITVTGMLAIGQGIHDIGLLFYALILIIASFLLQPRGMLFITSTLILSIACIVWGEIYGFLPLRIQPEYFVARPADFFIVSLSLIIGAIAITIMSSTMVSAVKTARDSEQRWKSLVDNAPDLILAITPEGTITFVNNTASVNPLGIKPGSSVYEFLSEDVRQRAKVVVAKVLKGYPETREIPIIFSKESTRWYSLRIGPIYSVDGSVNGAMIIGTNIQHMKDFETELRESRDALRKRAEQLAMLYDISKTVTSLRDLDNALQLILSQIKSIMPLDAFIVSFYDPEIDEITYPLVYDSGEIWQEKPQKLSPEGWVAQVLNTRKAFLIHRSPEELETLQTSLTLGNHKKFSTSFMVAPLIVGGELIGVISIHSYTFNAYNSEYLDLLSGAANQIAIAVENSRLYDKLQKELTERKRAEAEVRNLNQELESRVHQRTSELEEANNELASFTYTVSHDLRTPLRGIHGLSHIFLDEFGEKLSPSGTQFIKRIQSNASHMGQLIDDLLTFTHLGRQKLYFKKIDMHDLVMQVFEHICGQDSDKIKLVLLPLPIAVGDRALLFQVISNLLSNAIKYTHSNPHAQVEVGCEKGNQELCFYVRDNGVGFDMNYSAKLFGIFQRLHRQDEFEGTGVGLAIVKRIIQRHGGRVWAEGQPGSGATFYFTIPDSES